MLKKGKRILMLYFVVFLIILQVSPTSSTPLTDDSATSYSGRFERLGGIDRYGTAIKISSRGWAISEYVILARGDDFAGALCAGPLAKKLNAPILLTGVDELYSDVLEEIKRLKASKVIIIGGHSDISEGVEHELINEKMSVERIAGSDRYDTSVEIAKRVSTSGSIALAVGNDFADALSISSIASRLGMPILLTETESLSSEVSRYMSSNNISLVYIIGGTGAISSSIENSVPNPVRLGGKDRYETNTIVIEYFKTRLNFSTIYIATGNDFPDALTGGVLAAYTSSPIVLVSNFIEQGLRNFMISSFEPNCRLVALGGLSSVPQSVADEVFYNIKPYEALESSSSDDNITIDQATFDSSTAFNVSNAAPGDTFNAVYHIKNTGTIGAKLTASFNYTTSNPDLGTQLIITGMTFDGRDVALPEGKTYGTITLADINGVNLVLTGSLSAHMLNDKDFIISGLFYNDPVNPQNEYQGTGISGNFTFLAEQY